VNEDIFNLIGKYSVHKLNLIYRKSITRLLGLKSESEINGYKIEDIGIIEYHDNFSITSSSERRDLIKSYVELKINDLFKLSLKEYLDLSIEELLDLIEVANEINKINHDTASEVQAKVEAELKGLANV